MEKCHARYRLYANKRSVLACLLGFFVFLLVGAATITNTYATPIVIDPSEGIDVILVIDTSGSMRDADPERITLEAAALFMDMMETRHSRIGIVGFSGDVHSVMELSPIYSSTTRSNIRNTVSNFVYHGSTDIGLGLRTAAEMILNDPVQTNSPMILLFTDGRIDLPDWFDRTAEVSYYDAWWAVDNVGSFVPIYTIGLNFDDGINIDFLEEIASRTEAQSFIIEDAALLPELFHKIFANHIRSSINEIATVFPDGETFTDVFIPIPSHFVAEANIIMLSSRPITDIRLFDPMGREIVFDDRNYTLTAANRYSMIKIMEPEIGEWLLMVRGLPEDRITINLIYNYTVDVAFSITQQDTVGAFFDPSVPITVQAGFITMLSPSQIRELFFESVAEVHVFDLDMNPLDIIPMEYNGTAFTAELMPDPPQNVRINISVTHPGFSQTTTTVTISYDPDLLAALAGAPIIPPPDPIEEYIPELPPEQPIETPPDVVDETDNGNVLIIILIILILILVVLAVFFLLSKRQAKRHVFSGHLEVRSLLKNGKYTALEAPSLSTFAGKISIAEFLKVSLGSKANRILEVNVPINGTYIEPVIINKRQMLQLTTDGACHITDSERNVIQQKKYMWEKDLRLVFSLVDAVEKMEITYRINED